MLVCAGKPAQVQVDTNTLHLQVHRINEAMGNLVEPLLQPQFVKQTQRAGVHRVSAEVPQKIGVFFHHGNVHAGAGQQQTQHHARRSATGDHARSLFGYRIGGHSPILTRWFRRTGGIG